MDEVTPEMECYRDEIFGPVVSVLSFVAEDEALALANDTDYGLLVSLWTREPVRQRYFARRLEVGVVTINSGSALGLEPFFEYKTVWVS